MNKIMVNSAFEINSRTGTDRERSGCLCRCAQARQGPLRSPALSAWRLAGGIGPLASRKKFDGLGRVEHWAGFSSLGVTVTVRAPPSQLQQGRTFLCSYRLIVASNLTRSYI